MLVGLTAAAFALAACGGSATSADTGYGADGAAVAPEAMSVPGMDAGRPADGSVANTTSTTTTMDRQVIRTGSMSLQAEDVAKTVAQVRTLAADAGGYITAEDSSASGDSANSAYSSITAQVPAGKLDEFVAQVGRLGTVESINLAAQDVTTQVVDLDARIAALQTSVDRMTDLMAQANRIEDLLTIETQLSQRQAELDALRAQRAWLGDQVAMSTLSVTVRPVPTIAPVDTPGFASGLEQGWAALVSAFAIAVTALGFFLPFLVLLAILAVPITFAATWFVRRNRRRTAERAARLRAAGALPDAPVSAAHQPSDAPAPSDAPQP